MPDSQQKGKEGQTLIFMSLVIVMIAFAALFYFDVHKVLHVKATSRNAGDAAALAGARWQAISLNLIGELNVAQAVAISESLAAGQSNSPEAQILADLQRRIAFSGPIFGYLASQQAAKNNGILNQAGYATDLREHAQQVANEYDLVYPSPFVPTMGFETAWDEYADMLTLIADHGMAIQSANMRRFSNYTDNSHYLLTPAFYDAIAGESWCWFHYNAQTLIETYQTYVDWDPLPPIEVDPPVNSEINSLLLTRITLLANLQVPSGSAGSWEELLEEFTSDDIHPNYADVTADYAFYNLNMWGAWSDRIPAGFPWDREIRPQYDYFGADCAIRLQADANRHAEIRGSQTINWTAAAKPFGSLEGDQNPTDYGMVLPAYREVRLIPIDTSTGGWGGGIRPGWHDFIMNHLPQYILYGPGVLPANNWYANQLRTWEQASFRARGLNWIALYADERCQVNTGGGGGGGGRGGTYHGH